ncbi:MAG: hypothetical protein HOW73_42920 [Polyangiaceae bacterium]|nr:hypothetical protein [Polyangiaceae bacterium]
MKPLLPAVIVTILGASLSLAGSGCSQARRQSPSAPTRSGPAPVGAAPAKADAPAKPKDGVPATYLELFDDLVAKVEKHHVFAEAKKPRWPGDKARLRKVFEGVKTREDALVALAQLQAALGDRHCYLSPPTDLRPTRLALGIELFAETSGADTIVRVADILDPDLANNAVEISIGDEIVAVDGQSVEDWLAANPFASNSLNDRVALSERADTIVAARLPWTRVQKGDKRTLRLRRNGQEHDVSLTFVHPSKWEDATEINFDHSPAMSTIGCRADKHPLYSSFELSAVGTNLCVYRPTTGKRDTRLVRYLSFRYPYNGASDDVRAAKADHDLLARELEKARAVVLDLHENRGGNNPFVFLSWFAKKAWDHQQVHVTVSRDFPEDDVRQFLFGDPTMIERYQTAAAAGKTVESWPFLCPKDGKLATDGTCEARGPRPSEQVTKAPVAVVTGPDCTSSCDSFVADWSAFEMGPLVGQQPAHGFTTVRHSYALVAPDGRDLGRFRIALSWEAYPRHGAPLEGAPVKLDWETPATFETRDTWIDEAVKEARRRVER